MIKQLTVMFILVLAVLAFSSCTREKTITLADFQNHDISLTLDVPTHSARITDNGSMKVQNGWNMFYMNKDVSIESFTVQDKEMTYIAMNSSDTSLLPPELTELYSQVEPEENTQVILFKSHQSGTVSFSIMYGGVFFEDVSNVRFSNEMVGKEISGTILDKGAYLSPASYFYPQGNENTLQITLTANIPENWESISDGNRLSSKIIDGRKTQQWENPFQSDGVMFMAAPYVTRSTYLDSIEVACYFFESDTGLIADYLDATVGYIKMYSELIGPYPYKRFTVAENFFPTGYGMPAWTLLGQQVLRLPFIIRTSLGHEVLHNWWGNSVYVDYKRGNWCEAATVYGADYRYKLLKSPAEARDYRKNILKQYVSYVNEGNDFPIREFTSRTSPNTRTIGYNKAMMVYHMIEQIIGTDAFFDAWKLIYKKYIGKQISWKEWIEAFEETSGMQLSFIIPQWIDRAGAPIIGLEILNNTSGNDIHTVTVKLTETSGDKYHLYVPLHFTGPNTQYDTTVILDSPAMEYTLNIPANMTTLEVDPEYHLFRKLYPEEIEPIVSAIMGNPQKQYISFETKPKTNNLFRTFCENISSDTTIEIQAAESFGNADTGVFPVILNPSKLPTYFKNRVQMESNSIIVDGQRYPKAGHTVICTGENWNGYKKYMIVLTNDFQSLPRLGQLIPHYGKYSYLVFKGSHNVGKGQWQADASPLKKML